VLIKDSKNRICEKKIEELTEKNYELQKEINILKNIASKKIENSKYYKENEKLKKTIDLLTKKFEISKEKNKNLNDLISKMKVETKSFTSKIMNIK
jgi:hypothetical protein